LASLENAAQTIHDELSGNQQLLSFSYIRSIDKAVRPDDSPVEDIAGIFSRSLEAVRDKELAQGISLIGPHRDDLRFLTDNVDTGIYGSRGQQRTMALSLRLAEAEFMRNETGDAPVLLLDDVLSELDYHRRNHLLRHIGGYQQVLMTTTDLDYLDLDFLNNANLFKITQGNIQPLST
jgi:DNA replication and repair protein RecF